MDLIQLIPSLITLGVGGVIALVLILRTIPGMLTTFRLEMQAERASCDLRWQQLSAKVDGLHADALIHHTALMTVLQPWGVMPRQGLGTFGTTPAAPLPEPPADAPHPLA